MLRLLNFSFNGDIHCFFLLLQTSKSAIRFTGFIYQCRSVLENTKVTTSLKQTRKYKYRCIRFYVRFKDDKHVIWMWMWLILKNISLLDRIWSVWLVRFAHSPPNFIFWLGRLIFSVSINSHPDNIYLFLNFYSIRHNIMFYLELYN
jgi:hypothetical protein